jgi:hypothetical protein
MGFQSMRQKGAAVAAVAGLGALLVGCGTQNSGFARTEASNAFGGFGAAAPMAVSCEPNQRAVVRQVAVNGALQAQVQCETVNGLVAAGTMGAYGAVAPVAYQSGAALPVGYGVAGAQPVSYVQPAVLPDTQIVRAPAPIVTRQAAPQRVAYQRAPERVVKQGRSVKKSAIIIGSSAGVGAGVGAAVGGKKGAGIGALIGGGGAAIWDQITRRK